MLSQPILHINEKRLNGPSMAITWKRPLVNSFRRGLVESPRYFPRSHHSGYRLGNGNPRFFFLGNKSALKARFWHHHLEPSTPSGNASIGRCSAGGGEKKRRRLEECGSFPPNPFLINSLASRASSWAWVSLKLTPNH